VKKIFQPQYIFDYPKPLHCHYGESIKVHKERQGYTITGFEYLGTHSYLDFVDVPQMIFH